MSSISYRTDTGMNQMSSMSIWSIFHLRLENIPYIVALEKLAISRFISRYKWGNYTKPILSPRNLQVGWGRAQRYNGKISLILTGGRSNTLWGRLGFENWLFKASLKIGWTSCLGIVAIFQQVIMTLLGALYVTPFLECGSSVAL